MMTDHGALRDREADPLPEGGVRRHLMGKSRQAALPASMWSANLRPACPWRWTRSCSGGW